MDITGFLLDILINHNLKWMLLAYIIGGCPSGFVLARCFANVDIRKLGSKSIGATNVLRVVREHSAKPHLGKFLACCTVLADFLKGTILIYAALLLDVDQATIWAMTILVILGHCYSIFLGFKGGKGVATTAGALVCLVPISVLIGVFIWFVIGKLLRISSLASLIGLSVGIGTTFIFYTNNEINSHAPHIIILILVFIEHIPNIFRLIRKTECKVI